MKSLFKKAQESRKDLLIWYVVCFVIVVAIVCCLCVSGIIGKTTKQDSLISAPVVSDASEEEPVVTINNTDENISSAINITDENTSSIAENESI